MMARKRTISDVPDFLHDSPFIPTISDEFERTLRTPTPPVPYVIPSPRRILRAIKQWQNQIALVLLLYMLWRIDWKTWLYGPTCLSYPPVTPVSLIDGGVNWNRFAYVQYVTSPEYLCSSLMFFETLHRLGNKAERVIMYPSKYKNVNESRESMMLLSAETTYGVKTVPMEVQHKSGEYYKWADSLTKLKVFGQTKYKRIIFLDSDSTLLQPMDELFFLPSQPAVMPRAYWLDQRNPIMCSHIMVIEPSAEEATRVQAEVDRAAYGIYDMEIMNKLYGRRKDCVVLPHRKYALLSGEFRRNKTHHRQYMGDWDAWDAKTAFDEAKLIHFSDDPLPKPWEATWEQVKDFQPACDDDGDCQGRDIWLTLYSDYWRRAKDICWVNYGGLPQQY